MMTLRDFLQLGRAGSWPLMIFAIIGPYLINQPLFSLYTVWLFTVTFLLHTATILYNNVADYEWDRNDPSRQIHPLYNGRVDYNSAVLFNNYYMLVVSALTIITCFIAPGNKIFALIFLFAACISGHCYNDLAFSKRTIFSWLQTSFYTASLMGFGYFLGTEDFNNIVIFIVLYGFLRVWFQISYSGRLKDIATTEMNELKKMGARYENGFFYPGYAWLYALILTVCEVVTGLYIFFCFSYNMFVLPVIIAFLAVGGIVLYRITKPRRYIRDKEVIYLSSMEIIYIFLLPVILSPLIGYFEVLFLLVFSLLWFFLANRYIWGASYTKF